jgi:hypothetical protein
MALLHLDSFDHYGDSQVADKQSLAYYANIYTGAAFDRWGNADGGCLRIGGTSYYLTKIFPKRNEIYFGVAMRVWDSGTPYYHTEYPFLALHDENGVYQLKLHYVGVAIQVHDGNNVLLGTVEDTPYTQDKWMYIEVRCKIHDTAGEVEIRINEQPGVNLTGLDTKVGTDYIARLKLGNTLGGGSNHFDDLYIDDAQFHGNCRVRAFMPDSDGTYSQWTRSAGAADYEAVDEIITNEDTDYIKSGTLNHKSSFGITTGDIGVVKGIQLLHHVKAAAGGIRRLRPLIRSGGADYEGPPSGVISADYRYFLHTLATDPQDGQPWNQTKLEAAEFGLRLVDGTTTTSTTSTTTTT